MAMLWPSRAWYHLLLRGWDERPMVEQPLEREQLRALSGGAVIVRVVPDVLDCPLLRVPEHPL